jgi:hypothetical protein
VLFEFSILTYQYTAAAPEHKKQLTVISLTCNRLYLISASMEMNQVEHLQMQKAAYRIENVYKTIVVFGK